MIISTSETTRLLLSQARLQGEAGAFGCEHALRCLDASERLRASLRSVLALYSLSELQFGILVHLRHDHARPLPMAVLAANTGVSRSAVTEAIDRLESLGIACRVADPQDRRVTRIQLSQDGYAKASQAMGAYLKVLSNGIKPLSEG